MPPFLSWSVGPPVPAASVRRMIVLQPTIPSVSNPADSWNSLTCFTRRSSYTSSPALVDGTPLNQRQLPVKPCNERPPLSRNQLRHIPGRRAPQEQIVSRPPLGYLPNADGARLMTDADDSSLFLQRGQECIVLPVISIEEGQHGRFVQLPEVAQAALLLPALQTLSESLFARGSAIFRIISGLPQLEQSLIG